jgi:CubicO group peptidase (beta-lactamase class C family)
VTSPDRLIDQVLAEWPSVGLAVAVVRDGHPDEFHTRGLADIETRAPVDEDTVFRIASVTKPITAVALMQLWEQGLVDLDAPANEYLRGIRLVPAERSWRPATLRHLLTHTAGVRAARTSRDLLRPVMGLGAPVGEPLPRLTDYYRGGVHLDIEPGTRWAYSNHGFAVLGQIVEDVSGMRLDRYMREQIFEPLGMTSTDLVRSARVRWRLATGYGIHSHGPKKVVDREITTPGASNVYSSIRDMARIATALLAGGTGEHGSILKADTLALMYEPHYQPDPRIPGMGLAFFRSEVGGHRTVGHDGIWTGFLADLVLAPDDGVAVVVLGNTGNFDPRGAPVPVANALLRNALGVPDDDTHDGVPARPWTWGAYCGRYSMGGGWLTDPQPRAAMGGEVRVGVRDGQLRIGGRTPVPAIRRGVRMHADPSDPDVFRIDLTGLGVGVTKLVFGRNEIGQVTALYADLVPMMFYKRGISHA